MAHRFTQRVSWRGGRDGRGSLAVGGAPVALSIPKQLDGPGEGTNPEELLISAVGACYALTLGLVTARAQPAIARVEAEVHGEVEVQTQPTRRLRFAEIRIVPHIHLAAGHAAPSAETLERVCAQAEAACFITQTVKPGVGRVVLEPAVVHPPA